MIEIKVDNKFQFVQVVRKADPRYHSTRNDEEIAAIDKGFNALDIAQEILEILAYHNIECMIVEED